MEISYLFTLVAEYFCITLELMLSDDFIDLKQSNNILTKTNILHNFVTSEMIDGIVLPSIN